MMLEFFIIKSRISGYFNDIRQKVNDNILDLGCGENPYYHKQINGKIVCFDIKNSKKVHAVGDADFLPFKPSSFGMVVSVNSFYYFKNPFKIIDSISRILKKNGKLVIVLPFFYPIHDAPMDKYRFTEYGLRTLLESRFRIEKIHLIGGMFTLPSVFIHSIIKGFPLLFPKSMHTAAKILSYILWPLYLACQLLSLLDFLDLTKRVPTYYFVVASKR